MLYLRNIESVRCRETFMAVVWSTPERMRLRTALLRRSWKSLPGGALRPSLRSATDHGRGPSDGLRGERPTGPLSVARTPAALAVKRSKGERYTRWAPLGYRFEAGQLVEDARERETLARVREMKARGVSTARAASILNAEGVRCRGGRWHVTTIARALRRAA